MKRILLTQKIIDLKYLRILKASFVLSLVLSFCVYAAVRVLFFEIRNSFIEEILLLSKVGLVALQIGAGISILLLMVNCLDAFVKNPVLPKKKPLFATIGLILILTSFLSLPTQAQTQQGVKKDSQSGLTTTYQGLVPSGIEMVMNEEIIRHHDIPLGEQFVIRNKNVKGFAVKEGKVSVGCALLITDEKGKKVLEMPDLFKGRDVFKPEDMNNLKCTISTGSPMDWEKMYTVQVTYWDKYGKGKLINKVKIRMIDIP